MAALVSVHPEVFDCAKCPAAAKKAKGCYGGLRVPVFNVDGQDYYQCPARLIEPWARRVFEIYVHYANGHLPYAGGVMAQPAKLLKMMTIIAAEVAEAEAEKAKKK